MSLPPYPPLEVGDVLMHNATKVVHVIDEVRPTGYTWHYQHSPAKTFDSENSSDPLYQRGNEWSISVRPRDRAIFGLEANVYPDRMDFVTHARNNEDWSKVEAAMIRVRDEINRILGAGEQACPFRPKATT